MVGTRLKSMPIFSWGKLHPCRILLRAWRGRAYNGHSGRASTAELCLADEKDIGAVLLDVGGTDVSVYLESAWFYDAIPVGGSITNVCHWTKISQEAEK